jgi:hypothetical protein
VTDQFDVAASIPIVNGFSEERPGNVIYKKVRRDLKGNDIREPAMVDIANQESHDSLLSLLSRLFLYISFSAQIHPH